MSNPKFIAELFSLFQKIDHFADFFGILWQNTLFPNLLCIFNSNQLFKSFLISRLSIVDGQNIDISSESCSELWQFPEISEQTDDYLGIILNRSDILDAVEVVYELRRQMDPCIPSASQVMI
ncbi:hypothetical protein VNI00_013842 [Paramarasmius palmivorus]|uniref:Maturase K n=1 Tax=Paramarasmius palmivorus TaxID=297713 RepID=A0AAW0BW04_9AGAR